VRTGGLDSEYVSGCSNDAEIMSHTHQHVLSNALLIICCALVAAPHVQLYMQPLEKGCDRMRCVTRSA
jgi:hypothetical protein